MRDRILLLAVIGALSPLGIAETSSLRTQIEDLEEAKLYTTAVDLLQDVPATDTDFAWAQQVLWQYYSEGRGVDADADKAREHLRAAAIAGDGEAAFVLGEKYEHGKGVPASPEAAYHWYTMGAASSPRAALRYAEIALANRGRGTMTLPFDPVDRLTFAAEGGLTPAQFVLGMLLLNGDGVEQDAEAATRWLTKAADDDPRAQHWLATTYHQAGRYAEAKSLFERATSAGHKDGWAYLGHYAEFGIEEPVNYRKALDAYRMVRHIPWANEGARRLEEKASSIEMFGLPMYATTREQIKTHFKSLGLSRLGGEEYFDAYDVTRLMDDRRTILTIAYAPGQPGFAAELSYRFDTSDRATLRKLYDELLTSLTTKYDKPNSAEREGGDRHVSWQQQSTGIRLTLKLRENRILVTYRMYPYMSSLSQYVAAKRGERRGGLNDAL